MSIIWLIAWLFASTPQIAHWNAWMVTLCIALVIDFGIVIVSTDGGDDWDIF